MDYTNLKKRLIDNYHSQGLSNCIGSVEKVIDELFDGLEEEPEVSNERFEQEDFDKLYDEKITEIVNELPPLFTEEELKKH